MPDFWIHSLGGQLVLDGLESSDWKGMIEDNRKIYNLGCQGPDFFFYNDFLPWIRTKRGPGIGTMLHEENTRTLFLGSIDYLKGVESDENFSIIATYFLGFIVHYAIDKREHPFINARTKNFNEHKALEMKLDTYFIKKYWRKKVHLLSPSAAIDTGNTLPEAVIDFYKNILPRVYNVKLSDKIINDSYRDYKRVFDIFYSPSGSKKLCLNMLSAIIPLDISTFIYPTYVDKDFLTSEELLEFESIFKEGVSEAIKLIELFISYLNRAIEMKDIADAFQNISFSGKPSL